MIPTTFPLMLATALYMWQALNFVMAGNFAMALTLCAYALANIGLIWAAA